MHFDIIWEWYGEWFLSGSSFTIMANGRSNLDVF